MRFMLDENVPASVADMLSGEGHDAEFIREYVAPGSPDPVVATVSQDLDSILISFDGDFQKIAPRVPDGQRRRFRRLNRIWMRCTEPRAAERLQIALPFVETEFGIVQGAGNGTFRITISTSYLRTDR